MFLCEILVFYIFYYNLVKSFLINLLIVVLVSFCVLLERFYLRLSQLRLRPRTNSILRLIQTFIDAGKLLSKQSLYSNVTVVLFFLFTLVLILFFSNVYIILMLRRFISLQIIITSRININSYRSLSLWRSVLILISFDVIFRFTLIVLLFFFNTKFAAAIFIVICLVEVGRSPFDLIERESELVSGYNIEYRGLRFTLLFLCEAITLLLFSLLLIPRILNESIRSLLIFFGYLFIRSVLPRIKFNQILITTWGILNILIFLIYVQ